jgi:hypothetical protein
MSTKKIYSIRDRDLEDHRRIEAKIRAKDKTLSEVIIRLLRRWEREVER